MDNENDTAPKFTDLAQLTKDQCSKSDRLIVEAQIHTVLLDRLCTVEEANLLTNKDILAEKKANHIAWLNAANKRFYISFITAVLMCTAFFNKDFGDSVAVFWGVIKGVL